MMMNGNCGTKVCSADVVVNVYSCDVMNLVMVVVVVVAYCGGCDVCGYT